MYVHKLGGELTVFRYAVTDTMIGIRSALADKNIKKHPETIKRLKELLDDLGQYPPSFKSHDDIDWGVIDDIVGIRNEAYCLVEEL